MDYSKIIEEHQAIQTLYGNCQSLQEENLKKLMQDIEKSLKDKSFQECSQLFSEIFDIWLITTEKKINIYISPFEDQELDKQYKNYKGKTSIFPISTEKEIFAADYGGVLPDDLHIREEFITKAKERVTATKLLNPSFLSLPESLYESQSIIEYMLDILWSHIFQNRLAFLSLEDNQKKKPLDAAKYFHKNWPLYELINQISKTIDEFIQDDKGQKIMISGLAPSKKEDIVVYTEEICQHILQTLILNKHPISDWIPRINIHEEVQLSRIIATSDLVSYMFEYKLMPVKKKNDYLKK